MFGFVKMPIASFPSTTLRWQLLENLCTSTRHNNRSKLELDLETKRFHMPGHACQLVLRPFSDRLYHIFLRISTPLNNKLSAVAQSRALSVFRAHFRLFFFLFLFLVCYFFSCFYMFCIFVWLFSAAKCSSSVHRCMSPYIFWFYFHFLLLLVCISTVFLCVFFSCVCWPNNKRTITALKVA